MKIKPFVVSVVGACLLGSGALAAEPSVLKDEKARDSYSLGYQFGSNITGKGIEIDKEALLSAVRDALDGKGPAISPKDIGDAMKDMQHRAFIFKTQQAREQAARNLEQAKSFLEANSKKEGVVTLPSGLQYRVLREGKGASPKATDGVKMRFRGTLTDGTELDNTQSLGDNDVPMVPVAGAHRGWSEALQLMKPGAKWQVFIPPQMGYGEQAFGRVPANSVLVYEMELLSVVDRSVADKAEQAAVPAAVAAAQASGEPGHAKNTE